MVLRIMYACQLNDIIQHQPTLKKICKGTYAKDELPSLNEITVTYNCWPKCPSLISPSDEYNLTNNKPTFS